MNEAKRHAKTEEQEEDRTQEPGSGGGSQRCEVRCGFASIPFIDSEGAVGFDL